MWAWLVMSSSCWSCFGYTHRMCRPLPVCTLKTVVVHIQCMVLDRAGIYRSHPLSTPWFAPNLNNPGRRPTVYHIHTQQGQQNREKANSIGRRRTVYGKDQQYREKATSLTIKEEDQQYKETGNLRFGSKGRRLPLVTVQGDVHHYREIANCTSIGRRPYLLLPRYAHRAEHYPLPNIPYATTVYSP